MKCANCDTLLEDGVTVCPNCGKSVEENPEIVKISDDMEPPKLEVNDETLSFNATDINDASNVSTVDPNAKVEEPNEEKVVDRVDFAIPKVSEPVATEIIEEVDGIPVSNVEEKNISNEINENLPKNNNITELKIGGKKIKFKIGKSFSMPIVIAISVLVLIIGIFLGSSLFSKNYCATTNRGNTLNTKIKYVSDGKNNITNVGNYSYKIPDSYTYDKTNNGLLILDKNDAFRIYITVKKGYYADMSGAKTSIKETLKENATTVNNIRELNVKDSNTLVIETTNKMKNRLVAFTDATGGYIFYIEIVDVNNNFNYELLDLAIDIIKSATYEEKSTNMENIAINDISDIAIKAAQEHKKMMNK